MNPSKRYLLIWFYTQLRKGWFFFFFPPSPSWRNEDPEQLINNLHMPHLTLRSVTCRTTYSFPKIIPEVCTRPPTCPLPQSTHLGKGSATRSQAHRWKNLIKGTSKGDRISLFWRPYIRRLSAEGIFLEELKQNEPYAAAFCFADTNGKDFSLQIQTAKIFQGGGKKKTKLLIP